MIEVSEFPGLTIGAVSDRVSRAAADEHWLEDETEVRNQGFGKGPEGRIYAIEGLLGVFERNAIDQDFGCLGIFVNEHPVGFAAIDLNPDHKLADVYLYVAPSSRRKGIGSAVLRYLMDLLYSNGTYRVEIEVLKMNKGAVDFLREFGFTWESTRKSAYWMDKNVFDVAHLRMLRSSWNELNKED